MSTLDFAKIVGPALAATLERRGFTTLTAVQEAVLDPALAGRDLRITSQTGSGKTVAVGLAIRELLGGAPTAHGAVGRPRALIIAPTRELAKQFEEELGWLYAELGARVASATGGASVRDERRALSRGPAVVVGTPGRLLDHLRRGALDASGLAVVVLDEADRMLDLGFREDLLAILALAPKVHRTHLVSATFPADVRALADRVQHEPAHVEGTRLGAANTDIDHVVHLVDARQRLAAIVNLLLSDLEAQTLVFVRTRADVAELARELAQAGFRVSSLSGEMEQDARNRALAAFRRGDLQVLVATDVAARGIDVQDIARVIHADAPTDADGYTHRSGRTGRAGRRGTSSVLVSPSGMGRLTRILARAGVKYRFEPIPTADDLRRAADARLVADLALEAADTTTPLDERTSALAKRLVAAGDPARVVARLLVRTGLIGRLEPREVRPLQPSPRDSRPARDEHAPRRDHGEPRHGVPRHDASERSTHPPRSSHGEAPRSPHGARGGEGQSPDERRHGVPFRISWGSDKGADARRLLAMVCRRGGIRGSDVGAIRLARNYSIVEVANDVAESFAHATAKPDPRDPRITIRREASDGPPTHRSKPRT